MHTGSVDFLLLLLSTGIRDWNRRWRSPRFICIYASFFSVSNQNIYITYLPFCSLGRAFFALSLLGRTKNPILHVGCGHVIMIVAAVVVLAILVLTIGRSRIRTRLPRVFSTAYFLRIFISVFSSYTVQDDNWTFVGHVTVEYLIEFTNFRIIRSFCTCANLQWNSTRDRHYSSTSNCNRTNATSDDSRPTVLLLEHVGCMVFN